ncbi:alpha/beta-hydrolase family protein [Rhodococcus sp. NPDC003318]|uniref:alpha/beta-hydrolase family protein n=1 Tax=Rhodococcus sp. NPDC003318 TaxID=3364503 RepID=UPI00368F7D03
MTAVLTRAWSAPRTATAPRVATTVCVATAATVSLAPSLLPRAAAVQAIVTGVLVAVGWGLASLVRRASRKSTGAVESGSPVRIAVAWAGAVTTAAALLLAQHWQNAVRAAMGEPPTGVAYWMVVVVGSVAVAGTLVVIAAGIRSVHRNRAVRRVTAAVLAAAVAIVFWVGPTARVAGAIDAADAAAELSLPRPQSPSLSGSADSLTPWQTLGGQGRRFVTAPASPSTVRTYVGLGSAPDLDSRVRLAIRELERAGGFARSHLVITVPTGSGWIDANAVAGFERRFGGDVAEVAVQYSSAPSWATFVFDRGSAEVSARALYAAVVHRLSELPAESRPALYVYGQSLGAVGAAAAGASCGVLLAGPPGGRLPAPGVAVLANASDPVVHWSPRLLVSPFRRDGTRPDAPTPPWVPVVSFLQTTVDLLTALDSAPGHGHRYGTDQGLGLPDC